MIEVKDINNVLVDGKPAGTITDVLANYKGRIKEAFDALQKWSGDWDKTTAAEHEATREDLKAEIESLKAQIDALGGTELAKKLAAEKAAKERADKIESLKTEAARLEAEGQAT